ncbi:solute carrier organic anion transporter family member 4C1-like [Hydractinia symbiolongicarpus]|uniref:solute carrier organic anion transporter family member 4C1-like n=1 Tax=Hydractinia symbiolongicarpus TaxID=13093 RepID=UPI0025511980|nr:solute carrier organic anion transporter family member 4C1-like [Hydractinia symbiolongicarpus]XP_057317469.1 solute carrier organic anion transporter family member 4C1-like [Hydractinia symbiolongicarpus]
MSDSDTKEEVSLMCGWGRCQPKWLQRFATVNWFLLFLSLFSILQGMLVNGLVSASIPHLEREFGLTSTSTGFISASNDVSGLLCVLIVSYYGDRGHKPKWLGCGAILTGIGAFFFALPKFLKGHYTAGTVSIRFQDFETCQSNLTNTDININSCEKENGSNIYLVIFCVAEMIMGLGTAPLYTLGASFLDENVSPKNSPIYIGVWHIMTFIGPSSGFFVGGIVLNHFVDIGKTPSNLDSNHPLWVGRWWLPFILFCWVLIIVGFVMLMFPKSMPGSAEIRQKAISNGDVREKSKEHQPGLKGFVKATVELIKNRTLVLVCLAMASRILIASGLGPFLTKITIIKFGAEQSQSNFIVGALIICGTTVGLTIGSVVMRRIKVNSSVKVAAMICSGLSLLGVVTGFSFMIPGCENIKLVGVNIYNPTSTGFNLDNSCNHNCGCLKEYYEPICYDDLTYFSPCFAGCTNKTKNTIYQNCSCISPLRNSSTESALISKGKCNLKCKNVVLFVCILFLILVFAFANGTPNNMMVLRSVPDNRRSFAMGLQFLLLRSLAMLPGPVLVGKIIDSTCLVWKYDECGKKSNCAEYDVDRLSLYLSLALSTVSAVSFVLYTIAWKTYKQPKSTIYSNNNKLDFSTDNSGYCDDTKL